MDVCSCMGIASADRGADAGSRWWEEALDALGHARSVVEEHPRWAGGESAQARTWAATASLFARLHAETAETALLDRVVDAWDAAVKLTASDEERPERLAALGAALGIRAGATGRREDADAAVRALREAVDGTSEGTARLAAYRRALGLALLRRFSVREALTDLYEADWVLAAATHDREDEEAARAGAARAEVALELYRATGAAVRLTEAAQHYQRAADTALAAGSHRLAARLRCDRARVLERTAGPGRALEEYRKALRILADSAVDAPEEAAVPMAAIRRIEAAQAAGAAGEA
jgi:tetratricopeptide (TPR) repeat protein